MTQTNPDKKKNCEVLAKKPTPDPWPRRLSFGTYISLQMKANYTRLPFSFGTPGSPLENISRISRSSKKS